MCEPALKNSIVVIKENANKSSYLKNKLGLVTFDHCKAKDQLLPLIPHKTHPPIII